jgi:hypothetical protein
MALQLQQMLRLPMQHFSADQGATRQQRVQY